MNLEQVAKYVAGADAQLYFVRIYKNFGFKDGSTFEEYLQAIQKDTTHWFESFPEELKSATSFSKPKSCIIKLLKKDEVHKVCGARLCKDVSTEITHIFKTKSDGILKKRMAITDQEDIAELSSEEPEECVETKVTKEVVTEVNATVHIIDVVTEVNATVPIIDVVTEVKPNVVANVDVTSTTMDVRFEKMKFLAFGITNFIENPDYRKEMMEMIKSI